MSPDAYVDMANTEATHWWFCGRRKILSSVMESLCLNSSSNILEIGSGTGGNLEMLSRFGKVSAVEMDSKALEISRSKNTFGAAIFSGRCPDEIPFQCAQFDLICLFDVLEHIEQDETTLNKLKDLLNPNGRILITVPAFQWLWSIHDEYLHHKRRYDLSRIRNIVAAAGLEFERLTYFNTLLFPVIAVARVLDRLRSKRTGVSTGSEVPPLWINNALVTIFGAEQYLLRAANLPFGVSILGLIKPKSGAK